MPLNFHLRNSLQAPLEVDSLLPEKLAALSPAEIAAIPLLYGSATVPCGELFSISGSATEDFTLNLTGDLRKARLLGARMTTGTIHVQGSVGQSAGSRMSGGRIHIEGDAGDDVGLEMKGGHIRIEGRAGDFLGGASPGSKRGMRGGEIIVTGQAGNYVGHRMRRGMIVVEGKTGDAAGAGMIAGTLCLLGGSGAAIGTGMKRGTIVVGGEDRSPNVLSTFRKNLTVRPVFLSLLFRHLQTAGVAVPASWHSVPFHCLHGDRLEIGLGEIFYPAAEAI